jgi:serine/threonine-protein kinase
LHDQKKLGEAVAAFRKANQLLPNHSVLRNNLRQTERWLELDKQLPALLAGKAKLRSPQEQLELAQFCAEYKERYRTATSFFTEAFIAEPKLADDLERPHRYDAACAAALAGCGQGKDADQSDVKERTRLRRQALGWLRADLAAYRRDLGKEPDKVRQAVHERMQHWQQDKEFAGVRGESLAKLPETERRDWKQLWQEVETLHQRAAESRKSAGPERR